MAVTVPDWADTLLDLIGVAWPNVDEDAYRAMADSLREFAEDLLDDGQLANNHVERLLSASKGESIAALNEHWNKVKGKHFRDIADAARTIASAMDTAAGAVEAMKVAALVQLGYLAAEAGIAISLIPVTAGLSTLFGAAAMRATQEVVKRLIKECVEEAVGYIVSAMAEPAVAALEGMAADLVVQLGSMALGFQDGVDLGQTGTAGKDGFNDGVQSGKEAFHLASAGSSGSAAGGGAGAYSGGGTGLVDVHIEHVEHTRAGTSLNIVSGGIHGKTTTHLTKAKSHHGRTRGRDSIAQAIDPVADKAMAALTKATKAMGDHVGTTLPRAVRLISADHKKNDQAIHDEFNRLKGKKEAHSGGGKHPGGDGTAGSGGTAGGSGAGGNGGNGGGGNGGDGKSPAADDGPEGRRMDPQPKWHGETAGKMKHHRRDTLTVDHLSPDEQRALMVQEARRLADDARDQPATNPYPDGKHRLKTACGGTLLHDGVLTAHSSSSSTGTAAMNRHPALQNVLDQVEQQLTAEGVNAGNGHGKCSEVALISDRLHQLDPTGTRIVTPSDVQEAMRGSLIHTRQIGDMRPGDDQILHGEYKPPCRSCTRMLPMAGVTPHQH